MRSISSEAEFEQVRTIPQINFSSFSFILVCWKHFDLSYNEFGYHEHPCHSGQFFFSKKNSL